jgi:hypothetical protein
MKKTTLILIMMIMILGLTGCPPPNDGPTASVVKKVATEKQIVLDSSNVTTVGNNSYIAINQKTANEYFENPRLCLDIMNEFETSHPELIVEDYKIEVRFYDHRTDRLLGIWVHHSPKLQ